MAQCSDEASSWAITAPPTAFTSLTPVAPSSSHPVRTPAIARSSQLTAIDANSTSPEGRT
jgi:hypothetical protein